jgi:pyridoxal phosphate enzyme (YggS family)
MLPSIKDNLARINERIAQAALKVGKHPQDITLVAVSKTVEDGKIREAISAGIKVLGENRVQEAKGKIASIGKLAAWHLIGHLQRNKVKDAVALFDLIQSVDSISLAQEIDRRAGQLNKQMPALIQLNIAQEATKYGTSTTDLWEMLQQISALKNISIQGLMAIPPLASNPEDSRPYFSQMQNLFEQIRQQNLTGVKMQYLSMGMSHDFEVAIAEGANMVRIGTAIFGARQYT